MSHLLLFFSGLFVALFHLSTPASIKTNPSNFISSFDHGSRNSKQIALTFDADMTYGMEKELKDGQVKTWYNQPIINFLNQEKIPATIFMTGLWAKDYPQVARGIAVNPLFEIGNHSFSHPGFTSDCFGLPGTNDKNFEITHSQAIISEITGVTPKYFRFPGGCHTDADIKLVNQSGLTVVGWDDASGDAFNTNAVSIYRNLNLHTQNGSILLFHLNGNKNAPLTAQVLPGVVKELKKQGYTFVKLSDLSLN